MWAYAAFGRELFEHGEEFVFAVEAAVGIVPDVVRVLEFVRGDVFVMDAELAREGFGVPLVRFGEGRGIGGYGDGVIAEGLFGSPREVSGIGAAGVGYDDSA